MRNAPRGGAPTTPGIEEPYDAPEPPEIFSAYARSAEHRVQAHEALRAMDLPGAEHPESSLRPLVIPADFRCDQTAVLPRLEAFLDALVLRHKGD
jgi:hypothetical protein